MGFPLSNYYAMKRGDNISTHTLNQLCKLLQCRVEDVIEYIDEDNDGCIAFDDKDVPRALFQLKEQYPEKYDLFLEAVYSLFPEFIDVSIKSAVLNANIKPQNLNVIISTEEGT